jgi:RNA polymerase sigma-70 factor (ECF subfamily)
MTDLELVERVKLQDYEAFEELVRRYRNDVYRVSCYFLKNREEAWDVSQEVFIKAYRSIQWFRGDSLFKTWLLRITSNQCKDFLKKRRLPVVPLEPIGGDVPGTSPEPRQALEAEEIGKAIDSALQRLSHKHRTAFLLREYEGLSYDEMAQVMQCSVGTVMSRLHHARKKLQHALTRMQIVEGQQ